MYHQFNLWQKNPLIENLQSTLSGIRSEIKTKEDKPVSMSVEKKLLSHSSELKLEADVDMEKPIDPKYSELRVFIPEDVEEAADRYKEPPLVYRFKDSAREPKHKRKKHHKKGRKDIKQYKHEYYYNRSDQMNWRRNRV